MGRTGAHGKSLPQSSPARAATRTVSPPAKIASSPARNNATTTAITRSAPTPAAHHTTTTVRPSQQAPPPQHQPAPVAAQQAQPVQVAPQGPGLLGTVASVAAGSVIGHGISSMLFGGHTSAPAPQAPQQQAPPPATVAPIAPASLTPEADFNPDAYRDGPCGPYVESYTRCLSSKPLHRRQWLPSRRHR